jgi:hypothetical protein
MNPRTTGRFRPSRTALPASRRSGRHRMAHPPRGVRCRLRRVSRGRGNLRVQVHGRRSRLRDIRSSHPDVAGSPRGSRGPVRPALSSRGRGSPALNRGRRRAAVDRRLSRVGACRRRGRDSRCDPARARFPSSSVRRRCSPVRPQIVRREPIPHAGCSPVRRTARNRRHSGSPRRGQLPRLVRPVVPPRADRRRHLPRVDPVAEPAVVAGSGESHGA